MQTLTEKLIHSGLPDAITDADVAHLLGDPSPDSRYALVRRAMAAGEILRLRRGLYILAEPYRKNPVSLFALAARMYRPSYISLESALSAHGFIPEGVEAICSGSFRRARTFENPLGRFVYRPTPISTLAGVRREEAASGQAFLLATPLRALADLAHDRRWKNAGLDFLVASLRIEPDLLREITPAELEVLLAGLKRGPARRLLERLRREMGK